MTCRQQYTITFDEKVKGWTSFHSFYPDFMTGLNNQFFTFKNGNLYIHHSLNKPYNEYYGVRVMSKLSMMVNDAPSTIKELQAISFEGNYPWSTKMTAFISNVDDNTMSSIKDTEYVKKEGIWYGYARRNENINHTNSKSAYGIGTIKEVNNNVIVIKGYNHTMVSGDDLCKTDMITKSMIKNVILNTKENITELTVDDSFGFIVGDFVVGLKNARVEGGNLRGYTMKYDLEISKSNKVELFAVNSQIMKSFT